MDKMGILLTDWVENIVEKEEIASSFPTMFSKAVCCWCVKIIIYGVKG